MITLCNGGDGLCPNEAEADGKCDEHHSLAHLVASHAALEKRVEALEAKQRGGFTTGFCEKHRVAYTVNCNECHDAALAVMNAAPALPSDGWVELGTLQVVDVVEDEKFHIARVTRARFEANTSRPGNPVFLVGMVSIGGPRESYEWLRVRRLIVCRDDAETVEAIAHELISQECEVQHAEDVDGERCRDNARRILECLRGMR